MSITCFNKYFNLEVGVLLLKLVDSLQVFFIKLLLDSLKYSYQYMILALLLRSYSKSYYIFPLFLSLSLQKKLSQKYLLHM